MSRVVHMGVKYDPLTELDIDELVDRLTPGEIQKLLDECDPDDPSMPPSMRCKYTCEKKDTGPLDKQKLLDFINEQGGSSDPIDTLVLKQISGPLYRAVLQVGNEVGLTKIGESPGCWAATVANFCPISMVEHPEFK